jgi:hypothetical protein
MLKIDTKKLESMYAPIEIEIDGTVYRSTKHIDSEFVKGLCKFELMSARGDGEAGAKQVNFALDIPMDIARKLHTGVLKEIMQHVVKNIESPEKIQGKEKKNP